jgi:molybdopterin biosynthesis enzyme
MGWPKGKPRAAAEAVESHLDVPEIDTSLSLDAYIAESEELAQGIGLAVVRVTHPECKQSRHWDGKYAGFTVEPGESPRHQLSSGEWIE